MQLTIIWIEIKKTSQFESSGDITSSKKNK